MRYSVILLITVAVFASFFILTTANPIFEKLFGYQGGYGGYGGSSYGGYGGYGGGYRPPRPTARQSGGRSYKEICRTINADSYINPRGVPFPAQPFCPF